MRILLSVIFFSNMAICIFFGIKSIRIADRHYNWKEDFFAIRIADKLTEDEKELTNKYSKNIRISLLITVVLMLLISFLHVIGILFPNK